MRLGTCLLLAAVFPAVGAVPRPVVSNTITDVYRPLAFDQQKFAGLLANRMRANSEGYLEHVSEKQALASLETPGAGQNERARAVVSAGQLLEAAANAYAYTQHPKLKAAMDRIAKDLMGWQPIALGENKQDPHFSDYAWAYGYDLLGLMSYYSVTGSTDALSAARKAGDMALKGWQNESPRDSETATRYVPILEGMVYLYRYTGDIGFFSFCRTLAARLTQIQAVTPPTYQSLSELLGMLELYRVNGDEVLFRRVLAGWADTAKTHLSVTGTINVSHGEVADTCTTVAWLKLTANLLRITGQARYGQELERTIYNQVLASQDPRNGDAYRSVPLDGSKSAAGPDDACAAGEARALAYLPGLVWGRYGRGITVMLYTPGRATFQLRKHNTVQLYSEATYPAAGDILLHVEPAHHIQFSLRLRVPDWAEGFTVDAGGSHLIGRPGDFLTIGREWKRGDTVKISIPLSMKIARGKGPYADGVALVRGPQVLVLGKSLNPDVKNLADARLLASNISQAKPTSSTSSLPGSWAGDQAYDVPGEYMGKQQTFVFVPFADAINYRVWLAGTGAGAGGTY